MNTLRHTLRGFHRDPAFAIVAVLLLAAGIGSSCVIFSAMNAVLLRKLPVREPERLYRVVQDLPQLGKRSDMPEAVYQALRDHATSIDAAFGEATAGCGVHGRLCADLAERIRVHMVTPEYFSAIGVTAIVGRVLAPDDQTGAVLSYGFWQRRLAGDPVAVGRVIHLMAIRSRWSASCRRISVGSRSTRRPRCACRSPPLPARGRGADSGDHRQLLS